MSTSTLSPLLQAQTLLARMLVAAQRAGDIGREFLLGGLNRLLLREITFRRTAAGEARGVCVTIESAEQELARALAGDGIVDPAEAVVIRAKLRGGERQAAKLAAELSVPEVFR